MKPLPFAQLPDTGRLWIFAAARSLTLAEQQTLQQGLTAIVTQWESHGALVQAGFELRYDRFVLVGSDESQVQLSGCSMDYLRDQVAVLGRQVGLDLIDGAPLVWREAGAICSGTRADFKERVQAGAITAQSVVFDQTIQFVGELRAGQWERPFADCWHARAFRLPAHPVPAAK